MLNTRRNRKKRGDPSGAFETVKPRTATNPAAPDTAVAVDNENLATRISESASIARATPPAPACLAPRPCPAVTSLAGRRQSRQPAVATDFNSAISVTDACRRWPVRPARGSIRRIRRGPPPAIQCLARVVRPPGERAACAVGDCPRRPRPAAAPAARPGTASAAGSFQPSTRRFPRLRRPQPRLAAANARPRPRHRGAVCGGGALRDHLCASDHGPVRCAEDSAPGWPDRAPAGLAAALRCSRPSDE